MKNTVNYTDILKDEIKIDYKSECCHKAVFLAILYFSASIKIKGKKIHTEFKFKEASVFRKILPVIKALSVSRSDIKVLYTVKNSLKGIVFDINESSVDNKRFMDFLLDESMIIKYIENNCCLREFLKVIFLINGSIVNPSKQYFLEINLRNFSRMNDIINKKLIKTIGFSFSESYRDEKNIIYLKKFDSIIGFLSFIECSRFVMLLEEKSLLKGIRGDVNRQVNCEMNNISRKIECGSLQAERFIKIKQTALYERLDERSQTIIEYRIENPDLSYTEIGQLCDMTKAQVNYYIKKIERKYLKYNSNLVKSL